MTPLRSAPPTRGVALLDALAGFALLSLALLGLLRWQATAHLDARGARDRADAAAAAGDSLERLRLFSAVDPTPDRPAFADIADRDTVAADDGSAPPDAAVSQTTRVRLAADGHLKFATVTRRWTDARGVTHALAVPTAVDDALPVHAAALLVPAPPGPAARLLGRSPQLPPGVQDVGGGRGTWTPAGAAGGAGSGTSAPVFLVDLLTGEITGTCPPGTTTPSPDTCPAFHGSWLGGHVRFGDGVPVLPFGLRLDTHPAPTCGVVPLDPPDPGDRVVRFTCAVPLPPGRPGWSGRLDLVPAGWTLGTQRTQLRVCRYSADLDDSGAVDRNDEHPAVYRDVTGPLLQQNFLVIRGDRPCPHNGGSDATVPHQP